MAGKPLTAVSYIAQEVTPVPYDSLPPEERKRLASQWNRRAMEAAGYSPSAKGRSGRKKPPC